MNLRTLTNEELARIARAQQDPLTSSGLELELLSRFEALLAESDELLPVADLVDEYDVPPTVLRALLEGLPEGLTLADVGAFLALLVDADIDGLAELKQHLAWATRLAGMTDDPGAALDALDSLLITATL